MLFLLTALTLIRLIVWLLGQIFDAIIVFASFAVDLVFLGGMAEDEGQKAAGIAVLVFLGGMAEDEGQKAAGIVVVLLLWRIARVVDGSSTFIATHHHHYH